MQGEPLVAEISLQQQQTSQVIDMFIDSDGRGRVNHFIQFVTTGIIIYRGIFFLQSRGGVDNVVA